MTRNEAIATIQKYLDAADDQVLEVVAMQLAGKPLPTMTVAEAIEAFATDSTLPRQLTDAELALIEQSKADFRDGRTLTSDEMWRSLDAHLAGQGVRRSAV